MDGARSILLSITGGRDLSLWEVNEAAKAVAEAAHPEANIIFGAMVDEKLDDAVWVTVVATGYGDRTLAAPPAARSRPASRAWRAPAGASGPRREREREAAGASRPARERRERPPAARRASASRSSTSPSSSRAAERERPGTMAGRPRCGGRRPSRDRGGRRRACCAAAATPSTRRSPRCCASLSAEPLLTGPWRGRLHARRPPARRPGAARLLRRGPRPRRRARASARGAACRSSVSFGDANQVFNVGPASVGDLRRAGRRWRGRAALRVAAARPSSPRPRGAAGARGRRAQRAAGVRRRAARRDRAPRPRRSPRCSRRPGTAGRGRRFLQPELADALELLGAEGAQPFYAGEVATAVLDWLEPQGAMLTARGPRRLRGDRARPVRARYRGRDVFDEPAAVGGRDPDRLRACAARARRRPAAGRRWSRRWSGAQAERTPEFLDGLSEAGSLERFLRLAPGLDHAHLGRSTRDGRACARHLLQRRGLGRRGARHGPPPQQHDGRGGPQPTRLRGQPAGAPRAQHDVSLRGPARRRAGARARAAPGRTGSARRSSRRS